MLFLVSWDFRDLCVLEYLNKLLVEVHTLLSLNPSSQLMYLLGGGIDLTNWCKYQRHTVIHHIDPDGGD
jgi:hypothetical protein